MTSKAKVEAAIATIKEMAAALDAPTPSHEEGKAHVDSIKKKVDAGFDALDAIIKADVKDKDVAETMLKATANIRKDFHLETATLVKPPAPKPAAPLAKGPLPKAPPKAEPDYVPPVGWDKDLPAEPNNPSTFTYGSGEPEKAVDRKVPLYPDDENAQGPSSFKADVAKLMGAKDEPVKFHGEIDPK
jgi:hypothetical protein